MSDQLRFIDYVLRKGILKYDLDLANVNERSGAETLNILKEAHSNLSSSLDEYKQARQFSPTYFVSKALWFDVLTSVYGKVLQNRQAESGYDIFALKPELLQLFHELLMTTFGIMQAFKDGSKYYITNEKKE